MLEEWKIDYDGALKLFVPASQYNSFIMSTAYKFNIKRYVKDRYEGFFRFKSELTYLEYKKIIDLVRKYSSSISARLEVSGEVTKYIEQKEVYIKERYKLGNEIKHQDSKLVEKVNEYRSVVDMLLSRRLRDKQVWDSFFMCTMRKSANFSVPGAGKTAAVLGTYAYLKYKGLVDRILVICPKNAFGSWMDEFNVCFKGKETLRYFNIQDKKYTNASARHKAIRFESSGANLLLFNYEATRTYRLDLLDILDEHTLLVYDEVHKAKRVNGEIATNAIAIAKNASYVIAMTGTPIPNTYMDIYNMLHILFPEEYDNFFGFDVALLRNPNENEIKRINDKIGPFFCRTTKQQLQVPQANEDEIVLLNSSLQEKRLFQILKEKYRNNKLALMIRILQLETNPKLLLERLDLSEFEYIINDTYDLDMIDYVDYSDEVKKLIGNEVSSTKFKGCINLVERLVEQNKTVIVWCIFRDSIASITGTLRGIGIEAIDIYGEVPLEERQQIIHGFQSGEYTVLVTNPHTLGESVSLHQVCHDAIYYEYSYNLVHMLQSKDRIHRLGLPMNQYTQYYFLEVMYEVDGEDYSLDEQIYVRLWEKEQTMLDAIDNNMLETMPTTKEELDLIFQKLF